MAERLQGQICGSAGEVFLVVLVRNLFCSFSCLTKAQERTAVVQAAVLKLLNKSSEPNKSFPG